MERNTETGDSWRLALSDWRLAIGDQQNLQTPTAKCQPLTADRQPLIANCQPLTANCQVLTANRQSGFTYLTALFVVAFMGVGMAYVGEAWHTIAVREREVELLHVGNQYRKAIERYYKGGPAQYPRSLADLTMDPRKPGIERYLRRVYPDPVTGSNEWGIVKAPDGGVMGVYSLSEAKPWKRTNFRVVDRDFEKAEKYADWKFVFLPPAAAAVQPGAKPVPGMPVTPAPGQAAPGQGVPGTAAPVPAQAVPGSAMPGGVISPSPTSPAPGGPMVPGPPATGPMPTQPFLSTQPAPGGSTSR